MISLRAHGDSTGDFDDIGFSSRHDVTAAVKFLEERRPGRPVIIDGTSLGAAAAIFAAADLGNRATGYILESPYQDLKIAVWNRIDNALPFGLSHVIFVGMKLVSPIFLPHLDEICPEKAISAIPDSVPVLIMSGTGDRLARPPEARALFDRVASHAELVFVPGAGHVDLLFASRPLYEEKVRDFIRRFR
jgi:alpha-beta hydrolase superfamily lysophospholipase